MPGPPLASAPLPASPAPSASYNPSAPDTPIPAAAPENDSDYLYIAAANAAAGAPPQVVANVAKASSTPEDAADNAMGAAQYDKYSKIVDSLSSMTVSQQQKIWEGASPAEQAQLHHAGYSEPPPSHSSGFLSDVSGILGDVGHALASNPVSKKVEGAVGDVVNKGVVHDALDALNKPLQVVQHLARTDLDVLNPSGRDTPQQDGFIGALLRANPLGIGLSVTDFSDPSRFFSVKEWAHAWDQTSNGNHYITPYARSQVQSRYGNKVYGVALQLAYGVSPQQLIAAQPSAQREQFTTWLQQNNSTVEAATSYLNDGKLSIGRAAVGYDALVKYPDIAHLESGVIDGVFDWFADPVSIGQKAFATARAAQFAIRSAQDVDRIFNGASTGAAATRWAQHAVNLINDGKMKEYADFAPKYQAIGELLKSGKLSSGAPLTVEDVKATFRSIVGAKAMITGNALEGPGLSTGAAALPHLTNLGMLKLVAKGTLRRAADAAEQMATVERAGSRVPSGFNPLARVVHAGGAFAHSATTLVPGATDTTYKYAIDNPNGIQHLHDIFSMVLKSKQAADFVDKFFDAEDIAGRQRVYLNAMHEMGVALGLPVGSPEMDSWMSQFASMKEGRELGGGAADLRSYSDGTRDLVTNPGKAEKVATGVSKQQMADDNIFQVPDFAEAQRIAKSSLAMNAYKFAFNNQFFNYLMAGWRMATLAHVGFALRVAADEGILGLLRIGPLAYTEALVRTGYGAAVSHWAPEFIDQLREGRLYERWLRGQVPEATLDRLREEGRLFGKDDLERARVERELVTEHSLGTFRRAMGKVAIASADSTFRRYFPDLVRYGNYSLPRKVSMAEGGFDTIGGIAKKVEQVDYRNGRKVAFEFALGKNYTNYNPEAGAIYRIAYQHSLSEVHRDPWLAPALASRDLPKAERLAKIADNLMDDPDWYELSRRASQDRAGRSIYDTEISPAEITRRDAALDHADVIDGHVRHLITSPATGAFNDDLIKILQRDGELTLPLIEQIPREGLPLDIAGPEVVPVANLDGSPAFFQKANNWFFRKVIAPQVDALVRQPLYWDAYVKSRAAVQPWVDRVVAESYKPVVGFGEARGAKGAREGAGEDARDLATSFHAPIMSPENANRLAHQVATDRATRLVTPYIHNPELRSQFSMMTRNLSPFWFAQEQMYKRWVRSIKFAPWSVRQMQLIYDGLTHSGIVTTDPASGQEVFLYPLAGGATRAVTDALSALGVHVSTSLSAEWQGNFTGLTPALQDSFNLPNGPLISLPLHELGVIDPHLEAFVNVATNGYGDQSAFSQVMPEDFVRIAQAAYPGTFDASTYASAQIAAIKYLAAAGKIPGLAAMNNVGSYDYAGPPTRTVVNDPEPGDYVTDSGGVAYVYQPDGQWKADTATEAQEYVEQVRNTTRMLIYLKGIFGFFTPASPTAIIDPDHLDSDLTTLLNQTTDPSDPLLTYDQAIASYLAAHPNASPYTLATTQTADPSAYLPATNGTFNWLHNNSSFINEHPDAALYFVPPEAQAGKFSQLAYDAQLKEGFRVRDTPAQFYNQVIYNQSANYYYQAEDAKNEVIARGGDKATIDAAWDAWSGVFLAANPIFADQMEQKSGVNTRNNIMTAVGNALNDKDPNTAAPISQTTTDIKELYDAWVAWQNAIGNNSSSGSSVSSALLDKYNDIFAGWVTEYVAAHPDTQSLYNAAIRPAISTTLTIMADQQASQASQAGGANSSGGGAIASGAVPGAS